MDLNLPSTPLPPPKPKNGLWLTLVIISSLFTLCLGIFLGLLTPQLLPYFKPPTAAVIEASPTPSPSSTPNPIDNWQTYTDTHFVYPNNVYSGWSIKYPPNCKPDSSNTKILLCTTTNGIATIILNAGGHGGDNFERRVLRDREKKIIPAGEGEITEIENLQKRTVIGTFWINNTGEPNAPLFGFEFKDIPSKDIAEFEGLFDQILSTFKFLNQNKCSSDSECPDNHFCDYGYTCAEAPASSSSCTKTYSGSGKCIQKCSQQGSPKCPNGQTCKTFYVSSGSDVVVGKLGCK